MTKEDFEKSLLISNKTAYMDPRVDYRKWLRNTLKKFRVINKKTGNTSNELWIWNWILSKRSAR